ncbi:MAG: SDR family NAD(P)-dependent oxidoreductase [Planctomycetota bacterium]|nr:SDR family NAD(P)-dependent oxidoreductase [Planctomycetota bacterium]
MTTYLILGASRGVGHALARGLPEAGDEAWLVSRSLDNGDYEHEGVRYHCLAADLSAPDAPTRLTEWLGDRAIDVGIYNAGIWETNWTRADFESIDATELKSIIDTNLLGLILCVRAVLGNLRRAEFGKLILIGSISGLDHEGASPVAYTASKFGVRGVAHALRPILRESGIPITCLNPGWIANDVPYEEGVAAALNKHDSKAIPVGDIVEMLRAVLKLSPASCVKEIHMPALRDESA